MNFFGIIEALLRRVNTAISRYLGWLCVILTASMTVVVLIGIISRYFLQYPVPWTEEASRYLMVWMVFMAAPIALQRGAHVGLRLLSDRLRGKSLFVNSVLGTILAMIFLVFCIVEGVEIAWFSRAQRLPTFPISQFWIYLSIPLGSALMLFILIQNLCGLIRDMWEGSLHR